MTSDLTVALLMESMMQTKEFISAQILPVGPPFWESPDPRGGFYERKRLRIKKHFDDRAAKDGK